MLFSHNILGGWIALNLERERKTEVASCGFIIVMKAQGKNCNL